MAEAEVSDTGNPVNNRCYDELGDRWYTAVDDPIALLRAEGRLKNPWVLSTISRKLGNRSCAVLDIGCGAGYLAHALGRAGHQSIGIDISSESLDVARRFDPDSGAKFLSMSACDLSQFPESSFDAVCAMDFLEHTNEPFRVIQEASRVLKPDGLFFFHTFNRNWLSWLVVIKGVEWFVRNTPRSLHVYPLFIRPKELEDWCKSAGLFDCERIGMRPRLFNRAFVRLLATGKVDPSFEFVFTRSCLLGYAGFATRKIE